MADLLKVSIDDRLPQAMRALLSPEMLERILDMVAASARNEWIRLARRELHSSKGDYIRGIQDVEATPRVRVIALVGWLANAVESGLSPFDLRDTLLGPNSTIRRRAKGGGYYASVPFRHGTPGSAGQAGTPMGSSYGPIRDGSRRVGGLMGGDEAAALGKRVYAAAKQLRPSLAPGFAGPQLPSQERRLPPGMAPLLRGPNPSHPDPRMRRGHATDIYAGMIKEQHFYEKGPQTQYMTFRTISTQVVHGWIHPGIEAHHLADKVGEHIARIVPLTVAKVVAAGLGPGFPGPQRGDSGPGAPSGGGGGAPSAGPVGDGSPGSATPWGFIR